MDESMPPPYSYQELIKENINLINENIKLINELEKIKGRDSNSEQTIKYNSMYNKNPEFPPPMYG